MRAPKIFILSSTRALRRAGLPVAAALLMAAGMAAHAAAAQVGQDAPAASGTPQTAQPATPQSSSGPMVMGQNPDSTPDTVNAPATPPPSASQPGKSQPAKPGALVPWNPANPPGETGAAQPASAAPAPSAALPVPPPANAGGNAARQQINNECVSLLKMANELKAAVDKSNKDTLSITVVRKADDIEALAHQVKDEMRPELARQ